MDGLKDGWQRQKRRLISVHRRNVTTLRQRPLQELSGAFGDLGTFMPIFVALAGEYGQQRRISVASTLVFSGLANILTGLLFGIPLPVQPMKAIAAIAIERPGNMFGAAELASAGLFVAICVGLLSATGLIGWFTRAIPVPVVKGIQVGAGLTLAIKGMQSLVGLGDRDLVPVAIGLAILLFLSSFDRFPLALIVVCVTGGLGIAYLVIEAFSGSYYDNLPRFSLWSPSLLFPTGSQFLSGAGSAGLGQLPLTTLNSVVAVVYLAEDLFPDFETPTATSVGISVAVMNLVGIWFKAMPVCHGSGGLAAQYRFGARSGASVIFLGSLKLVLGLFASRFALAFCAEFPTLLLAVLLLLAGLELAKMGESVNGHAARDLWHETDGEGAGLDGEREVGRERSFKAPTNEERERRWNVMAITIIGLLGAKNDGIGFLAGMLLHGVYNAHDWWKRRAAARQEGGIRIEDEGEGAEA